PAAVEIVHFHHVACPWTAMIWSVIVRTPFSIAPASSFTTVVLVRVGREAVARPVPECLAIDRDEHDGSRLTRPVHPDGRRHGSGAPVHALPHAAGRPEIPAARRRRPLAFLEAGMGQGTHDVIRRGAPSTLVLDP